MVMSTVIMTARGDDPLFLICVVNFFAGSERCSMQSAVVKQRAGDDATSGCECKVRTRAVRVARARGAWRVRVRVRVRLHMRKPARTTTHRALSETE